MGLGLHLKRLRVHQPHHPLSVAVHPEGRERILGLQVQPGALAGDAPSASTIALQAHRPEAASPVAT